MFDEYKADKTLRHRLLKEIISIYQEGEHLLYPKTKDAVKFTAYGLLARKNRGNEEFMIEFKENEEILYLNQSKPSDVFDKLVKYYRDWELIKQDHQDTRS